MRIEAPQFHEPSYYDQLVAKKREQERPEEDRPFRLPKPTPPELAKYLPSMVLGRWSYKGGTYAEKRRGKWYVYVPRFGFRSACAYIGPYLDEVLSGKSTATKIRLR